MDCWSLMFLLAFFNIVNTQQTKGLMVNIITENDEVANMTKRNVLYQ